MPTPVSGVPRLLLRVEGLCALVAAIIGYQQLDGSWGMFALLLLVPDVALFGYLAGPRVGAIAYNAFHTYLMPAALAGVASLVSMSSVLPICLIWIAHIGMDRALGLGLKFGSAFQDTHLGSVRQARAATV
jgi:hypothetical protein